MSASARIYACTYRLCIQAAQPQHARTHAAAPAQMLLRPCSAPNTALTPRSALLATGIWMLTATYWELPVSSTQVCQHCNVAVQPYACALRGSRPRPAQGSLEGDWRSTQPTSRPSARLPPACQAITAAVAAMAIVAEGFGSVKW